jgi:hypothetical protein
MTTFNNVIFKREIYVMKNEMSFIQCTTHRIKYVNFLGVIHRFVMYDKTLCVMFLVIMYDTYV